MPFVDQREKRASVLDEPYAAGIILTLRDRELNGEAPYTLSGVKHTVSANYNSVKKILIWMEDMDILEINKSIASEHMRPGRPGHNVELTDRGREIADHLDEVVKEMGKVPNYRKNAGPKGKKVAAKPVAEKAKAASKPAAKSVAKPATKTAAKPVKASKSVAKPTKAASKPAAKSVAKPATKTAAKPVADKAKTTAKKSTAKKATVKKSKK